MTLLRHLSILPSFLPLPVARNKEAEPASEPAHASAAASETPPQARPRHSDGGFRTRLKKLVNTKTVPHQPAVRLEGEWDTAVAPAVCRLYVESQLKNKESEISLVALSEMKALDYERSHRDSIEANQRLLQPNSTQKDYYEAQVKAFLKAIGIQSEEAEELLASFKLAGTGGLHRQHVTGLATVSNAAAAVSQFMSASHPAAAAALYGVRVLLQFFTGERILDSGYRRLRNSGTEDMLPLGRADAGPSAKQARSVLQTSHAVIWELHGVKKSLCKLEAAMARLDAASNNGGGDVLQAKSELEIAFARICYQMAVKAEYKASSESAKVEFRGNERYLKTSYAGTGLSLGAGVVTILGPFLGVAAAPVTGGISAGVALMVVALYVGYQLSFGPSKDGEEKAKRAIVALSKSLDVLSGDKAAIQADRASAYKDYLEVKKASRFKMGREKAELLANAKAALLARLADISRSDSVKNLMSPQENWRAWRSHRDNVLNIEAQVEAGTLQRDVADASIKALESTFQREHKEDFSVKNISGAWKVPIRMRTDTAARILKGKVARSCKRLINLTQHPSLRARINTNERASATEAIRQELQANLRNAYLLDFALNNMKLSERDTELSEEKMRAAVDAIAAIDDIDVRNLFCGNGEEQVEAVNNAKKLTAGEAQRYVYTNAGASALNIGMNASVVSADFSLNMAKATHAVHVGLHDPDPQGLPRIPKFADFKVAGLSQAGAPLAAHLAAGDRAGFQKVQMPKVLAATTRDASETIAVNVNVEKSADRSSEQDGRPPQALTVNLDALFEQLETNGVIPDQIILTLVHAIREAGPSSMSGAAPVRKVTINLQSTSAYHAARYKEFSAGGKLKVAKAKAQVIGSHAAMSLAGLPAQAIAQLNLRRTRPALRQAVEMSTEVRQALKQAVALTADQSPAAPVSESALVKDMRPASAPAPSISPSGTRAAARGGAGLGRIGAFMNMVAGSPTAGLRPGPLPPEILRAAMVQVRSHSSRAGRGPAQPATRSIDTQEEKNSSVESA